MVKTAFTILFLIFTVIELSQSNPLEDSTPALLPECELPNHPSHGQWKLLGKNQGQPGDYVQTGEIIKVECNKSYAYQGVNLILCTEDGVWSDSIGSCKKLCPPVRNTTTTTVACRKKNIPGNCAQPDEGTVAQYTCQPFYETSDPKSGLLVCNDGTWDRPRPECRPVCGERPNEGLSLIGEESYLPWHISVYSNIENPPKFICAGTLISENFIITAAHCVTDPKTGALLPKEQFSIAAAKRYRHYNDSRDINPQFSKLKEIYVRDMWRGETLHYQADIAILLTEERLQYSNDVRPICMDYDGKIIQSLTNPDDRGRLISYDFNSDKSEEIGLSYIKREDCEKQLPEKVLQYLSSDKFCTGYTNQGVASCRGSSGNGLFYRNRKDGRYYLAGVLSIAAIDCSYGLSTNITSYAKTILELETLYRIYA